MGAHLDGKCLIFSKMFINLKSSMKYFYQGRCYVQQINVYSCSKTATNNFVMYKKMQSQKNFKGLFQIIREIIKTGSAFGRKQFTYLLQRYIILPQSNQRHWTRNIDHSKYLEYQGISSISDMKQCI